MWLNINTLTGLGKDRKSASLKQEEKDDGIIVKDQEAAEFMNEFYISAGPNLTNMFTTQWDESDFKSKLNSKFTFAFIEEEIVNKLARQIDLSKSAAMGNLSTRLLKDAFECITLELTFLYNCCFESHTFPRKWGMGFVTPFPKTNSKSKKAKDWRPVSQISLPGKLLERIVHSQLIEYLEGNNLLFKNQHGFRSEKSTSSAVFGTLKTLLENWNRKLHSTCVYIDFARAFDSIDHSIFVRKLCLYGLDDSSIKFIKSYISSRVQCTRVNGYLSTEARLQCGTAQGSILGPLFFILYVNDIFSYVKYNQGITMYADDTLLIAQGETLEALVQACQESLNEIINWCNLNKLTVNIDKTKTMTIVPFAKNVNNDLLVHIDGKQLQQVHKYEYLGVIMDDKLCMNNHIECIIKKVQGKLCTLRKFRKYITTQTALHIYKGLILCHLDYGDFVVDTGNKI